MQNNLRLRKGGLRLRKRQRSIFFQPTASAEAMAETSRLIAENIVGWGIGIKTPNKDEETVLVYVKESLPYLRDLPQFGDLSTDIVEVGQPIAYLSPSPIEPHRPVLGGSSIGHPLIRSGTLGCLVEKEGNHYILSNNHVIAATNRAEVGDPVVQPGPYYGGSSPEDTIAFLEPYQSIDFSLDMSTPNRIDAAIAKVGYRDQTIVLPEIIDIGPYRSTPLSCYTPVLPGLSVQKYGQTTMRTQGFIQAIDVAVKMGYDVEDQQCTALFDGQITIVGDNSSLFSEQGDSGALILDLEMHKPIGLLVGGSNNGYQKVTYANPIDAVLEYYDVTIVGD